MTLSDQRPAQLYPTFACAASLRPRGTIRLVRGAGVAAAAVAVAGLYWIQSEHSRLLVSWHGFLHAAIATRFPSPVVPPENPFFAGEPLPYYWFYQWVASRLGAALRIDVIRAFQLIILASLAGLVLGGASLGRRYFGSVGTGLLTVYLVLAGANPLGPIVAGVKGLALGHALVHGSAPAEVTEAVFVTNEAADRWMTHPVLGAQYFGYDWRFGQNLVWFFDISSRAPAIAIFASVLLLLLLPRSAWNVAGLVGSGAAFAAFNPVMALPAAGALAAAAAVVTAADRAPGRREWRRAPLLTGAAAVLAGVALAAPTYVSLFADGQGGAALTPLSTGRIKWVALALTFAPVVAMAAWGAACGPGAARQAMTVLALAGTMLVGAGAVFELNTLRNLERGNEHNLVNAALCVLAVPAVAWLAPGARQGRPRGSAGWVVLAFAPAAITTVWAYLASPPIPIGFDGPSLVRLPKNGPLDAFYSWVRETTPEKAIFVVDPSAPVKMSGNVAELPAFTGRTLFVDQPGYMTDAHRDAAFRRELARVAVAGGSLSRDQQAYLVSLARPVFVVTYRADSPGGMNALEARHGRASFHNGFVAAFALAPGGTGSAGVFQTVPKH
jgi:hypothetical protein